jgi:hypothetical protein
MIILCCYASKSSQKEVKGACPVFPIRIDTSRIKLLTTNDLGEYLGIESGPLVRSPAASRKHGSRTGTAWIALREVAKDGGRRAAQAGGRPVFQLAIPMDPPTHAA